MKKHFWLYFLLPVLWLLYHLLVHSLLWSAYHPVSFILRDYQGFIRLYPLAYFILMGLHDFLVNLLVSLPFAFILVKTIQRNILNPILFAAVVVFLLLHRQLFDAVLPFDDLMTVYHIIGLVGLAVLLPCAYGFVRLIQTR